MILHLNEEQKLLQQTVREFAEKELGPRVPQMLATNELPLDLYKRVGELGFWRVNVPVELGGAGLGQTGLCIVLEELARVSPAFGLTCEIPLVSLPIILQEEALIKKYLEKVMNGDLVMCYAATDPKGLPNAAEWDVTFTKDGDGYRVNGTKMYVTNNSHAGLSLVVGLDEKREQAVAFVEGDMPGHIHNDVATKIGMAGTGGGTCHYNNVYIPAENLTWYIPEGGTTSDSFYSVYNGCAAEALGCMKGIFQKTVEYCKNRTNNFKPLTDMQAVSYKLAEMQTIIEMCDSMVYGAAQLCDAYNASGDPELEAAWHLKSESVKVRVSEFGMSVATECLKLHGGLGYHDPNIYHYLGDSLDYAIMDLTNEIHFASISDLMGLNK
ncbi:MAG TPA: acyl-CoA dehydrogenase family protein [Syntrophomonas sp.]|nr:acyl-CoA dehydrogenase family protein [Syntrophomonas sp.]